MSYWNKDPMHWHWDLIGECAYHAICPVLQEPVTWGWSVYRKGGHFIIDYQTETERVYHCSRGDNINCRDCAAARNFSGGKKIYEMTFLERIV